VANSVLTLSMGTNGTLSCSGGACSAALGANSRATCTSAMSCQLTIGAGSTVTCVQGCAVECLGDCDVTAMPCAANCRQGVLVSLDAGVCGCRGSDGGVRGPDAGIAADGGLGDAGAPDAGGSTVDGGVASDAGAPDAGGSTVDGGVVTASDAGAPDAGGSTVDAGAATPPDAGGSDAGALTGADAGISVPDAGAGVMASDDGGALVDAGDGSAGGPTLLEPRREEARYGVGCESGPGVLGLVGLLLAWATARRSQG
jgi:hypothetical protein